MRIRELIRRHPLPAILVAIALVAVSVFGVYALTSQPASEKMKLADNRVSGQSATVGSDSRYTVWQPAEYLVPEVQPPTKAKPALAPVPKPNAWSQLACLEVSLGEDSAAEGRDTELPAPAGMDDSLNPFERSQLIAAASVETGFQGSGPVQLPSYRVQPDVCVPSRDPLRVRVRIGNR
jgi:hypothetical protein